MANEINCTCNIDENNVRICYPPISGGGGSGITGVGSVDYITKIKTLVGADGSAIVTIGKSDIYDAAGAATWTKSLAGGASFNFTALNLTSLDYANIYAQSGLTGIGLVWSNTDAGVVQKVTNDSAGLTLSVADKGTSAIQTALVLSYSKVQFYSPDSPLGTAGTLMIDSTGYIYTSAGGGGGITSLNSLTASAQTFTNDTNVTIVSGGTAHVITWSGTLADARIASAATWNAKESALTFSTGLTRATNTITNNLLTGVSGGQTILSGTAATDKMILQTTSGNQTVGVSNLYTFKSGNNGANELLRIGDGIAANIGELSMWAAGQSSNTTHFLRAGTNFTYINAGTDLRLMVGANNYINMLSGAGTVAIQKPLTFASGANVTLVAGSTTLAPLVFTSGTNKTTATAGSVEYNGQFSMTPTDATRRFVVLAASATKTTAGAPYTNDGYVTLNINGSDVKFMTTA